MCQDKACLQKQEIGRDAGGSCPLVLFQRREGRNPPVLGLGRRGPRICGETTAWRASNLSTGVGAIKSDQTWEFVHDSWCLRNISLQDSFVCLSKKAMPFVCWMILFFVFFSFQVLPWEITRLGIEFRCLTQHFIPQAMNHVLDAQEILEPLIPTKKQVLLLCDLADYRIFKTCRWRFVFFHRYWSDESGVLALLSAFVIFFSPQRHRPQVLCDGKGWTWKRWTKNAAAVGGLDWA